MQKTDGSTQPLLPLDLELFPKDEMNLFSSREC